MMFPAERRGRRRAARVWLASMMSSCTTPRVDKLHRRRHAQRGIAVALTAVTPPEVAERGPQGLAVSDREPKLIGDRRQILGSR
jgi:hypothetical protein